MDKPEFLKAVMIGKLAINFVIGKDQGRDQD